MSEAPETPVAETPPAEPKEDPRKARFEARQDAYRRKVKWVTGSLVSAATGLVLCLLFLADFDIVIDVLVPDRVEEALREWIESELAGVIDVAEAALQVEDMARLFAAAILNLVIFAAVMLIGFGASGTLGSHVATRGETGWGELCVGLARTKRGAATWHFLAGVLLMTGSFVLFWRFFGFGPLLYLFPLLWGLGLGAVALGRATLIDLPRFIDDDEEAEPEAAPPPAPEVDGRMTGEELLGALRESPVYRGQVAAERAMGGMRFLPREGSPALGRLVRRYPKLRRILPVTGVTELSSDQERALELLLEDDARRRDGEPGRDFVFWGWPGAGRTTLSSLVALAAVLHREGAMYCVTASAASHNVTADEGDAARARHPSVQLRRWLEAARVSSQVHVAEAHSGGAKATLDLAQRPDLVFTDVRMLTRAVLSRAPGDGRHLLARLRYVVIDHPERLPREDLIRLRIAIARLRMTAELLGASPTFLLLVPPLNNHADVAKYLLGNPDVPFVDFGAWFEPCHVVGWLPPLEEAPEYGPDAMTRADFTDECIRLLTELGVLLNDQERPPRVAVIDAIPLLGPEARETVRARIRDRLRERVGGDDLALRVRWTFFGSTEVALDRTSAFDVILVVGVGPHPDHLLLSLRAALADDGVIVLIGDSSPADMDALRLLRDEGWPGREVARRLGPGLILPDHSEAVIAHELAALFEDFKGHALPRARLEQLFRGEHVERVLDRWLRGGSLEAFQVFRRVGEHPRPEREIFLRPVEGTLRAADHEVPWGCCSRDVYRVYDLSARSHQPAGPYFNDYVDADRRFIDFFPLAMLRYPPHTVRVEAWQEDAAAEAPVGSGRYVNRGDVQVRSMPHDACIRIDRRTPRLAVELLDTRKGPVAKPVVALGNRRATLVPEVEPGIVRVRETLRDVVRTGPRLVEEPTMVHPEALAAAHTREYECVATRLRFVGGELPLDGDAPEYAAVHGLARTLGRNLVTRYLNARSEVRVAVVPGEGPVPYQLVVYRLHRDELGDAQDLFREALTTSDGLRDVLMWVQERLVECDCTDGCSRCCGGLGTAPAGEIEALRGFEAPDAVSRRGAYELVCALLATEPAWTRFEAAGAHGGGDASENATRFMTALGTDRS